MNLSISGCRLFLFLGFGNRGVRIMLWILKDELLESSQSIRKGQKRKKYLFLGLFYLLRFSYIGRSFSIKVSLCFRFAYNQNARK